VPFLLPQDTSKALDELSDPAIRNDCGVSSTNSYLCREFNSEYCEFY